MKFLFIFVMLNFNIENTQEYLINSPKVDFIHLNNVDIKQSTVGDIFYMNKGVYYIKCEASKQLYIGSSINIKNRFLQHKSLLIKNKHYNKKLQLVYNTYGLDNLKFDVLEFCDYDYIRMREKFYIDFYDTYNNGLNCTPIVEKYNYGFKHSEETKNKISKNNARYWKGKRLPEHVYKLSILASKKRIGIPLKKETAEKISKTLMNHNVSNETKLKISISNTGKKHPPRSESWKLKISIANKGRKFSTERCEEMSKRLKNKYIGELSPKSKPIIQLDKNNNIIKKWISASWVQRELGIKQSNICKVLLGKRDFAGGYKWKYA